MISTNNILIQVRWCVCRYFFIMKSKRIIRFGFCGSLNDQGLGKPRPSARLLTLSSTLIIPDITKTSSNNC